MRAHAGLAALTAVILTVGLALVGLSPAAPWALPDELGVAATPPSAAGHGADAAADSDTADTADGGASTGRDPGEVSLAQQLQAALDVPALEGRRVGVMVTDGTGDVVTAHRADEAFLPASTQKLPVAAAALLALGPEFRYETQARATAPVGDAGVLDGSVVLVGSGDPALATREFATVRPERPRTPLEAIAEEIVDAGVRRITGGVIGDPGTFTNQPLAPGWPPRYLEHDNTSRVSGLTVDGGRRLYRDGGHLASRVAAAPAATAAVRLHGLLVERGVTIDGSAAKSYDPPRAPRLLARVASPPLRELLRHALQRSDNHFADAIFRTLGREVLGDSSWDGAAEATRRVLSQLDLAYEPGVLADGSGLSRRNRLSPRFLTALDVAMHRSPRGDTWHDLLAVAGRSGTLRDRLRGTPAAGRLHGKTGSLADVTALAGVVGGPEGQRYHFAVLGDGLDRAGTHAVRVLQDRVAVLLAAELWESSRTPVSRRDTPQPATGVF